MELAITAMSSTTTAAKKKMVAVARHISERPLVSPDTRTSPRLAASGGVSLVCTGSPAI